jgi:hypothetical protein
MQQFKIYDELLIDAPSVKLSDDEIKKVCSTINSLPLEHVEIIFALIVHYYISELRAKSPHFSSRDVQQILHDISSSRNSGLSQPYGVRKFNAGKGVIFTMNTLPEGLQQIVISYVRKISS